MKTKIIYISGNELFEMTAIRAAMDEVRATLGLDKDTILFGVPVDCDTAIADVKTTSVEHEIAPAEPLCEQVATPVVESVIESVIETPETITPVVSVITPEPVIENEAIIEPVVDVEPVVVPDSAADAEPAADVVIPILSVLSVKEDDVAQPAAPAAEVMPEPVVIDNVEPIAEPVITDVPVKAVDEPIAETVADPVPVATESVSIEDMITDEAPTAPMEKTLEQLFDSLTPLREDVDAPSVTDTFDTDFDTVLPEDDAADATLAQLATEFASSADKIKPAPQGKISKLKNIIPFKPKREEPSLMGDLFGWAGMAANDDDFAIPGFFKKQG